MATTLEIANQALLRVGAEPITALTSSNERARAVNASWDFVRREVLRSHSWNSATRRRQLVAENPPPKWGFTASHPVPPKCLRILSVDSLKDWRVEGDRVITDTTATPTYQAKNTIDSAPTAADPVSINSTAHGYSTGDVVMVESAGMTELNDRHFSITVVDADNFTLDDEDGASHTVATGGTVKKVLSGLIKVRYIKDLDAGTDGLFDPDLEQILSLRLAIEIVERVTDSTTKRQALMTEYGAMIDAARSHDGQEQSDVEFEEDAWITARY